MILQTQAVFVTSLEKVPNVRNGNPDFPPLCFHSGLDRHPWTLRANICQLDKTHFNWMANLNALTAATAKYWTQSHAADLSQTVINWSDLELPSI